MKSLIILPDERKGFYLLSSSILFTMVLYSVYTSVRDLLNSVLLNLGGDHRGYGKVDLRDLPKVNITWCIWHSLGIEPRSPSTITPRTHDDDRRSLT